MKFSMWLEGKDIFGFEKNTRPTKKDPVETQPIQMYDIEQIVRYLAMYKVGELEPEVSFVNEITWGTGTGALRVMINNWLNVMIERKVTDLTGKERWIAKKIYQLNHKQSGGANIDIENAVSQEILQEVERVYKSKLDSPKQKFDEFQNLVTATATEIRRNAHEIFIYQGIRRINENNYIIRLGVRGHGIQRRGQTRVEENHTQMTFDSEAGLIRLTNYNIASPLNQHEWAVTQTDLDWYFAPTQQRGEIAQTISTAMHWY